MSYSDYQASGGHFHGYEEGRLLALAPDGQLKKAQYRVEFLRPTSRHVRAWETHTLEDMRIATSSDIVNFDRLNRSDYRETWHRNHGGRRAAASTSDVWRHDLGRNWRIRVPHAGMEASLALKRFKEHGTCITRLAIEY